jgi:WD40 repeat protein
MEQVHEFNTSEHDPPSTVASSYSNAFVAVGFKSGFFRVFEMTDRKMIHENMVYESTVMAISFSQNGKFMAVFFKNGKIVIINTELDFTPIKNIDYEFPNGNYFSLDFSPDGGMIANISSNANTITVWETKNFSLKHYCDFTGEVITKI